jgi:hypothetical protein
MDRRMYSDHSLERQRYAELASIMLGACMVHESTRIVVHRPWPGFAATTSHVVSALLVLLWGVTAAALLNRRHSPYAAALSWPLALASVLVLAAHSAFVLSFSGQPLWGVTYLIAAAVSAFLVRRV